MTKVQEILSNFTQEAAQILEKIKADYQKDPQEQTVENLRAILESTGNKVIHEAIAGGIDNQLELVKGIQESIQDKMYRLKHG